MYGATASVGAALGKRKDRSKADEKVAYHLPPALRQQCPAECELYDSLVNFNQQVDAALSKSIQMWHGFFARKREGGLGKVGFCALFWFSQRVVLMSPIPQSSRTLRLCVYNVHENQTPQYAVSEGGALEAPRWTLRIEGRLLPDAGVPEPGEGSCKFSHYIKHVSIQLDEELYKNDSFVEWDSRRHVGETDGFELTREGDRETKVRLLIEVAYPVQLYTLSAPLRALVGSELDTHDQVLRAIWFVCCALTEGAYGWLIGVFFNGVGVIVVIMGCR